jgi:small multidrug resistance pump
MHLFTVPHVRYSKQVSHSGVSLAAWVMLAGAIGAEVSATLALRASDGLAKWPWIAPVALGYLGAFTLLSLVLKAGMPVGVAYGIWSAAGVVLTAALARAFFGDPFTWAMAAGAVLIGAGALLVETGASAHAATR